MTIPTVRVEIAVRTNVMPTASLTDKGAIENQ